ncbi:MAG TPA: hypothetical protein VHZ07_13265 [Bryobacteraceae bacterium]|jgi:hypothetical protein|nr:hypothetical protein [Bryobacteraceae bacterium]
MSFPYPYFPVQFTKEGTVFQQSDVEALMGGVAAGPNAPTDLFFTCHGWNNNIDDATSLYSGLANLIKAQVDANPALAGRKYAICGVLWPSKKFEDKDLIPSGAAALNDAVTTDQLKERVRDLRSLYGASEWPVADGSTPAAFDEMEALMDSIEDDEAAQARVVDLLRPLLPQTAASPDDASDRFFETGTKTLIANLKRPLNPPSIPAGTGAASLDPFSTDRVSGLGGAASFRDVLGGIKSGFLHLLNYATYYLMKARAGDVGVKGLVPLIVKVRGSRGDLRIHLIGHSFGCRLVAAAVNALPEQEQFRPDTVMLLQGAFSHNGFALDGGQVERGAFRDVIEKKKVRGPIVITHTRNDQAVGTAYPIASRINGVVAAALGDENDIYGGLGSNGTQTKDTTPERIMGTLLAVGQTYPFASGVSPSTPCNLKADEFVKGHSDIQKPEVAFALTVAMSTPAVMRATP